MNQMEDETEPTGKHFSRDRRITIAGARRMLGMISRNYTDEEIGDIMKILYGMAEEAYENYFDGPGEP